MSLRVIFENGSSKKLYREVYLTRTTLTKNTSRYKLSFTIATLNSLEVTRSK